MKHKRDNSDSEEDETFYYRYASTSAASSLSSSSSKPNHPKSTTGSGGLAPSKSTLYVSNIDYSLTNSDLHTLFSTFGKIARVTVLKDRVTRRSKGVAFVQFVSRNDAVVAARQMNNKILNGRTITASIASDNGRAAEFIKKRVYKDKSRCYECGEFGHLSYDCPKNQLGPREKPPPVTAKRGRRDGSGEDGFEEENWASVVDGGADERLLNREKEELQMEEKEVKTKKKKASYFSDESDEDE